MSLAARAGRDHSEYRNGLASRDDIRASYRPFSPI